jgi:hypothetical protein
MRIVISMIVMLVSVSGWCALESIEEAIDGTADESAEEVVEVVTAVTPPSPEVMKTLIQELDSDEYAVRQSASEKLLALGAPVLPMLQETVLNTKSAEVQQRARIAIERIKDEIVVGGPEVDGYKMSLSLSTDQDDDDKIQFDLTIRRRDKPMNAFHVCDVDYEILDGKEHPARAMVMRRIDGSSNFVDAKVILTCLSGEVTESLECAKLMQELRKQELGEKQLSHYTFSKSGKDAEKIEQKELAEDAIEEHDVPLSLSPGEYKVQIVYTPVAGSMRKKLKSNVLRFKVKGEAQKK